MDARCLLLGSALAAVDWAADRAAGLLPTAPCRAAPVDGGTLAVLIPERGTPALLDAALASVRAALDFAAATAQIVVVANGHPAREYGDLVARHAGVDWIFERRPLGFGGAVTQGLRAVRAEWVYLLNSDMTLAPDALAAILPWRDRRTFAIASQVFFADPGRRREETGWTDYAVGDGVAQHFDRMPEDDGVRGHLYAGGGASLFRTCLLRRFAAATAGYAPFYFEDADWGVQAARAGLWIKFCPHSRAWHRHRATIARYYPPAEIERIVRRNQLLFEARHGLGGSRRLLRAEPDRTRRELAALRQLPAILRERWRTRRALLLGFAAGHACSTLFPAPVRRALPVLLIALHPAVDAAKRAASIALLEQVRELARWNNLVLVTDASWLSEPDARATLALFCAVHGIGRDRAGCARNVDPEFARQLRWWERVYRSDALHVDPGRARRGEGFASADGQTPFGQAANAA